MINSNAEIELPKAGFGEPPKEYAHLLRLSPSRIMEFAKSPRHYKFKYIDKNEVEPTKAMELGTSIHKAILEPDKFDTEYCVKPTIDEHPGALVTAEDIRSQLVNAGLKLSGSKSEITERLKAHDPSFKFLDEIIKEAIEGKEVLTPSEFETCKQISKSILESPDIIDLIHKSEKEKQAWFIHESGCLMIVRIDMFTVSKDMAFAVDLKTSRSASRDYFQKVIWENKLFIQAAIYVDALKALTGLQSELFGWLVCETAAPYSTELYAADFGCIEAGREMTQRLIDQIKKCHAENKFPSYNGGKITNASLPHWAWQKMENENAE